MAAMDSTDSLSVRPALERTLDPDSILALLPRDAIGHADWAEALRRGLFHPRAGIHGRRYSPGEAPRFGYDFFYHGPDTSFDAWFPHSVHAEVIDCRQCHGPIVQYRDQKISMSEVLDGEYCGRCHGKVAFPVITGCKRCHVRGPFPEAGGSAELLGTIVLARAPGDSGISRGVVMDSLPRARFPHWVHRIRYQCRTCHMQLFVPRAGANTIRMADIQGGRACGACHDGNTAFRAGFGNCERCHAPS
ncbi:MAG: hypothetical protein HZB25_09660 [Candidatus Eisenbacteria bacterium]|nr:hypothetical protein [Candidatus Eisenbacteria bacterium]